MRRSFPSHDRGKAVIPSSLADLRRFITVHSKSRLSCCGIKIEHLCTKFRTSKSRSSILLNTILQLKKISRNFDVSPSCSAVQHAIQFVDHLAHDGATVFDHACRLGLEGISQAHRCALSGRAVEGVAQEQEPGERCGASAKRNGASLGGADARQSYRQKFRSAVPTIRYFVCRVRDGSASILTLLPSS